MAIGRRSREEIGPDGALRLESIGFACPLIDVYAQTHLA